MGSGECKSDFTQKAFYKWEVLFMLWVAFFLNQADRQIYNTLIGKISQSLELSPAEAGLIATMFSLVFALLVPVSGLLAENVGKKKMICFSVMLWSIATVMSGTCTGIIGFLIFRSLATGMGEACFGPANYATISDWHSEKTRATAMSIHQTSYYLGVIASGFLAGWIADTYGWRSAFYVFGMAGVLFGIYMIFRLRDKKFCYEKSTTAPSAKNNTESNQKTSFKEALCIVFKTPSALCLALSFAGLIFVLQGYLTWATLFLQEKFSMSNAQAGFEAMFFTHISALVGVLVAGRLSDILAARFKRARILMQAAGLFIACPFILMMGLSESLAVVYIGFAGFGFWRAVFDANTYSVLYDVIPRRHHSAAAGVMLFFGFGAGSLSPYVLGLLKPILGLSSAIALLAIIWLVCSAILIFAAKFFYLKDLKNAQMLDGIFPAPQKIKL